MRYNFNNSGCGISGFRYNSCGSSGCGDFRYNSNFYGCGSGSCQ